MEYVLNSNTSSTVSGDDQRAHALNVCAGTPTATSSRGVSSTETTNSSGNIVMCGNALEVKANACTQRNTQGFKIHLPFRSSVRPSLHPWQLQPPHQPSTKPGRLQRGPASLAPPSSPSAGSRSLDAQPGSSVGRSRCLVLIRGRRPCRPGLRAPPDPSATSVEASSSSPAGC